MYPGELVSNFWYQVGKVKACCNFVQKSQACSELYAAVCICMLYLVFADFIAREEQPTHMPGERLFAFDMHGSLNFCFLSRPLLLGKATWNLIQHSILGHLVHSIKLVHLESGLDLISLLFWLSSLQRAVKKLFYHQFLFPAPYTEALFYLGLLGAALK